MSTTETQQRETREREKERETVGKYGLNGSVKFIEKEKEKREDTDTPKNGTL